MQLSLPFKRFYKNHFFKNILVVMSGTVIAQIITVAVSPILTRLFNPSAFGVFGVYMALVSIIISIITLRYDQALMLPKKSEEAACLFWASLLATLGISSFFLILLLLFSEKIILVLRLPELSRWILFLPISVFILGVSTTFNSWCTRQMYFKRSSVSQVVRSVTASGIQVSSGFAKTGPVGLIGGTILGDFFSSLFLWFQVRHNDLKIIKEAFKWHNIKRLGIQYSNFPFYSSTQNFLNAISQNIPLLFLAKYFGPTIAGFYALGVRVIQLPMDLVLTSLRQVLFQRASAVYNSGGNMYSLFKKITLGLLAVGIMPALTIILFGPAIFSFVLGKEWVTAGVYARWLVLWLFFAFINPPSTLFIQIFQKQRFLFFQDLGLLISRVLALIIGGLYLNALTTVIIYSLLGMIVNIFIIAYMLFFVRKIQGDHN